MKTNAPHNEYDLLHRLAKGEEEAFTAVHRSCYTAIYLFARRLVPGNPELAQDAASETFIDLWKGHKLFSDEDHLQKYLRVVVRNKCIDRLRLETRHQALLAELEQRPATEFETIYREDVLYTAEVIRIIRVEVEKLPPHTRKVFQLSFFEGLSNAEIAARTGMKNASVRVRKAEALNVLRLKFAHDKLLIALLLMTLR